MKGKNLIGTVVGTVVGIVVLYATVFYASRGWKKGQSGEKLV